MKKDKRVFRFELFFLMAMFCQYVNAQDQLFTDDGEVIAAWDVEFASSNIFYKTSKGGDNIKSIAKSKVLMWKKADGTKVRVDAGTTATTAGSGNSSSASDATGLKNAQDIANFNKHLVVNDTYQKKDPTLQVYNFWANEGTVFENDNVKVVPHFVSCYSNTTQPNDQVIVSTAPQFSNLITTIDRSTYKGKGWQVSVQNKTGENLYIDQASSFFIVNGQARAYYVPKSSGNGSSNSTSAGLGLGLIGIGASSGTSSSQSVFTQRVLIVPPMSTMNLDIVYYDADRLVELYNIILPYFVRNLNFNVSNNINMGVISVDMPTGQVYQIPDPSPLTLGNVICYSTDENFSKKEYIKQSFYLKECAGIHKGEHCKGEPNSFNSEELQLPLTLSKYRQNCAAGILKSLKSEKKK